MAVNSMGDLPAQAQQPTLTQQEPQPFGASLGSWWTPSMQRAIDATFKPQFLGGAYRPPNQTDLKPQTPAAYDYGMKNIPGFADAPGLVPNFAQVTQANARFIKDKSQVKYDPQVGYYTAASNIEGDQGALGAFISAALQEAGLATTLGNAMGGFGAGATAGDLAGGSFAGDPIGAMGYTAGAGDPIEAIWRATEATGVDTATGAATEMGFGGDVSRLLTGIDPSWVTEPSVFSQVKNAYDTYGKPIKTLTDIIQNLNEPVLKRSTPSQPTGGGGTGGGSGAGGGAGGGGFTYLPQPTTTATPGTSDAGGTKGPGQAVYSGPGAPPPSNTSDVRNALGYLGVDSY